MTNKYLIEKEQPSIRFCLHSNLAGQQFVH